jgi:SAM-dependent methyltransferase
MSPESQRYFIKADYAPNLAAGKYSATVEQSYWTPERIANSRRYQYDVYRAAADLMQRPDIASVLDVGSGPPAKLGSMIPGRPLRLHLVDQPQCEAFARELLPAAKFTAANLEGIDLDLGDRFDLVICADVIEHLADPDPCLRFIRRHLSDTGLLLISTPERDLLRGPDCRTCPHPAHVREWNREEFRNYLQSRGWLVVDQRILPQQQTSLHFRWMARLLAPFGHAPDWYSCQLAICRPA